MDAMELIDILDTKLNNLKKDMNDDYENFSHRRYLEGRIDSYEHIRRVLMTYF